MRISSVRGLRAAIREQRVTFPAQAPVFRRVQRPDIQWRLAVLYFVRGWSTAQIGERYKLSAKRVHQLLNQWKDFAVERGLIDRIPTPEECGWSEGVASGQRAATRGRTLASGSSPSE